MNKYILYSVLFIVFNFNFCYAQNVVINEVMYSNNSMFFDSFGNSSDWIELYNSSDSSIDLHGWKLGDSQNENDMWILPDINISAGEYLVIFASGKNITRGAELHTNFKIKALQDNVVLKSAKNELISNYPIQCVPTNYTLGYFPNASENLVVMLPTPGFSNNSTDTISVDYTISDLSTSHPSGFYNNEVTLSLYSNNINTQIYYTLNGKEPDENSILFSEPIVISAENNVSPVNSYISTSDVWKEPEVKPSTCAILRAVAYHSGCPSSPIISQSYFVGPEFSNKYSVPVVSVITNSENLFDDKIGIYVKGNEWNYNKHGKKWERDAYFEYFVNDSLRVNQEIGIRIHGGISRERSQKSLRLYAKEMYGKSFFEYQFFKSKPTITRFKTLYLRTVSTRNWAVTLFNDDLAQSLVNKMNIENQASQTVVVYVNGEYWGIHSLREYFDDTYIQSNRNTTDSVFSIIAYGTYPYAEQGNIDDYNQLIDYISKNSLRNDVAYEYVTSQIDISNLIDYYIATIFFASHDFPDNNLKMYKSQQSNSKWRYLLYDLDDGFQRTDFNAFELYVDELPSHQQYSESSLFLFRNLLQNSQFRQKFVQRAIFCLQTYLNPDVIISEIERYKNEYSPLLVEHMLRWNRPRELKMWESDINTLELFAMQRSEIMLSQLLNLIGNPFIVYPNPTTINKGIHILGETENCENLTIKITSLLGQIIYENNLQTCNLNDFVCPIQCEKGIYNVTFIYNSICFTSKLLIE